MDKGIHFRDNTYGLAGIAGDPHATAVHEYGDWAQWAQIPAGNVAERIEGLSNYAKQESHVERLHVGVWHSG